MNLEEFIRKSMSGRQEQLEGAKTDISIKPEEQLAPTLGQEVKSMAQRGDTTQPEKSGASIYRVPRKAEKIEFLINTARDLRRVPMEPVAAVLGKIVRNNKGVQPKEYEEGGENWESNLMEDQATILDLALQYGVKPLFIDDKGNAEQGVFEIPGKGIVFVEEFHKIAEVPNSDKLLPPGENLFGSNWVSEVPGRVSEIALAEDKGTDWVTEEKSEPAVSEEDEDEATKSASLDIRRQEIQRMMFPNIPGTVTRITAFLQEEPAQMEQLTQASNNQATFSPVIETNGATSGASNQTTETAQIPVLGGDKGMFISQKASFVWAPESQSYVEKNNPSYNVLDQAAAVASAYESQNPLPSAPVPVDQKS